MKPSSTLSLTLAFAILTLCGAGCGPSFETRTYDITVRNDSTRPVTLWLTKTGPAYEQGWKSPEDLAIESPKANEPIGAIPVPVGKTAYTGKLTGRFRSDVDAVLRVYVGLHSFSELLAISRGSSDRLEIALTPGKNDLVVTDLGPTVQVKPGP